MSDTINSTSLKESLTPPIQRVRDAMEAADSARLKTARELLEEVLGDDDADDEETDADGEGEELIDQG